MNQRIVLAGGTGFIGQSLAHFFEREGYEVAILSRGTSHVHWDGSTVGDWIHALDGALAVVNLTGKSINCRHTPQNRREIIASRVNSVLVLGEAIGRCSLPPKIFLQAAGVGIYGDKGEKWCDEGTSHGDDFVTNVCEKWEGAFDGVVAPKTRKVLLRLGVVLGPNGGFLEVLGRLTKAFLGGHVGNGRQYISWIHINDLRQIFLAAIERKDFGGVFNACSPNPVTNSRFMRKLRHALHRPWSPPVPKFAARIGSWIIGTEADLAFVSQRCTPKRLLECGFAFGLPNLREALANIYPNK